MEINALILLILLGLVGGAMLVAVFRKSFKKNGGLRMFFMISGFALLAYGLVGMGAQFGMYDMPGAVGGFFLTSAIPGTGSDGPITCPAGTILQNGVCVSQTGGGATYQPTASYSARDKYSTTSIAGTSYYKVNGNSATTTAYTNVNIGDGITYWVSNDSYWMVPVTKTAGQGVNLFEAEGFSNSTVTLGLYDTVNREAVDDATYNTSMGANDQANIEITYQGTAEGSGGPFGGVMIIEYNSTMSSVICTGEDILSSNPYHLTYTVTLLAHTHKTWAYGPGLDDGSGAVKRIDCQFKNGATKVGAGSIYYVKFAPADYYVTDSGDIVLDTEKHADGDTTRTGSGINYPTATGYFGA